MNASTFASGLALVTLLAAVSPAYAQEPVASSSAAPAGVAPAAPAPPPATNGQAYPPGPPAPYAYPPYAVAPTGGGFVAPLSQTSQPTYLPQSVALSGPRMLKDWHDGDPIPYGYHREERARRGMVISGSILFGVPYIYSTLIASAAKDGGSSNDLTALFFPVLGPFIQMANTDSMLGREMLAIDGVLQATGAFLFIYGLAVPRAVLVRNDLAMMTVTPMHIGKDGTGLGLMGIF